MHDATDIRAQLAEERRLIGEATEGPWEFDLDGDVQGRRKGMYPDPEMDPIVGCLEQPEDNAFIAHARTALPVRNAQVQAVLALHREEVRWIHEANPEVSWGSREQALEWDDEMDPEDITTFSLCSECKRVEEGPDGEHIFDVGYGTSTWPCPTVRAIEEAGK